MRSTKLQMCRASRRSLSSSSTSPSLVGEVILQRRRAVRHVRHRFELAVALFLHRRPAAAVFLVEVVVPVAVQFLEPVEFQSRQSRRASAASGSNSLTSSILFAVFFFQLQERILLEVPPRSSPEGRRSADWRISMD